MNQPSTTPRVASLVDERLKPLQHFVAGPALQPGRMRPSDTQAVVEAGWDEKAVFEAVSVCAFYSFMNRYVDGTGLRSAAEALREMGRQLAAHPSGD